MAAAVEETLDASGSLLIEAATGTGKTWAYLIPAILSGKKVVISTGTKTLQDQLFFKDLPFLKKSLPQSFSFSMMKGKSNYLCLQRFDQFFQQSRIEGFEVARNFEIIQDWAMQTESGDHAELKTLPEDSPLWHEVSIKSESCLGGKCADFSRCYLTRMKQAAATADIVVVNHHLYFADLALREGGYGEVLPHHDAVIFDEAHLLEEVATQHFGISFSSYRIDDFVRDAEKEFRYSKPQNVDYFKAFKSILRYSAGFFRHFSRAKERYRLSERDFSPEALSDGASLFQALKQLDRRIGQLHLKSDGVAHLSERIEALLTDLQLFLKAEKRSEHFIYWAERRRQAIFLHASPLDVSEILYERLFQGKISIVLTSATLSSSGNFEFIKERLGINVAREAILETTFDYKKQALIYLPTHLSTPSSPRFPSDIAGEIIRILEVSKGRAFLLFTSWRNLEVVYQKLSGHLPYPLLKQGDQPKQALIEAFRAETSSVLFGTSSFWQGVDVAGEALSCVIIDKLPFASPDDPLTSARIEALARNGKAPFQDFQVPLAILSLRQGVGRLIRNNQDRGLIAILDHRIRTKSYGREFLAALPSAPQTSDFSEVLVFFS